MDSMRAPSYKAIAIAILKNDHACHSLGFQAPISHWYYYFKERDREDSQPELFT
jgi:predicted phosphoadenosine phosphosulfate sulfurtransferase